MENMNLKMFNKLVDSAEGLEINLKVGKECELNVRGNFMAMTKVIGIILQRDENESKGRRDEEELKDCKSELDEYLDKIK